MKYKKILRHVFLTLAATFAAHVHAATTDYTLKYGTWELIAVPNPIPFAVSTPMKMFGEQIAELSPLAEYGRNAQWVMYSYDSGTGLYEVADKDAVFDPGKGYWAKQIVSSPGGSITVQVVTRYNLGARGPGGGIVFYVDPDTGGTSGLEAAPVDQSTGIVTWCFGFEDLGFVDIVGVVNLPSVDTEDPNSGAHNTQKIINEPTCGATSAAGVAAAYIWPEGQTDGFLPNKEELNLLYAQRDIVGGFASRIYWSSSEFDNFSAWNQDFRNGLQSAFSKSANALHVRAVRAF